MSGQYKVAWLCEALLVSRSGYYDWKERRHLPGFAPTGEHPLARAHPRGICSQSPDLRQPRAWLMRWAVRDGAIALLALCAWSESLPGSAPNIGQPTTDSRHSGPIAPTDCTTSLFDTPISLGQ